MTLASLTASAQEELEAWELSAMGDPRNWVRPAAAALVTRQRPVPRWSPCGYAATTGPRSETSTSMRELAERTLQDIAQEGAARPSRSLTARLPASDQRPPTRVALKGRC